MANQDMIQEKDDIRANNEVGINKAINMQWRAIEALENVIEKLEEHLDPVLTSPDEEDSNSGSDLAGVNRYSYIQNMLNNNTDRIEDAIRRVQDLESRLDF